MRFFAFFLFTISVLACVSSAEAGPQTAAPPPEELPPTCDAEFYKVMNNRAWMEGKRELEAAQKIILKPDSVLQYSCFEASLNRAQGLGFYEDGNYIDNTVRSITRDEYLSSNFDHNMGGGSLGIAAQTASSTCDNMYRVWDLLKCKDFEIDDFTLLSEMAAASNDLRQNPEACSAGNRTADWESAIEAANPPPASPAELGGMDMLVTYLVNMNPEQCGNQEPIETGLMIRRGNDFEPEKICAMPGCNYNGSSCVQSF